MVKTIEKCTTVVVEDLGAGGGTFFAFYSEIVPGGSIIFFFLPDPGNILWGITVVNLSVFTNLIIIILYLRKHFFGFIDK